MRVLMSVIRNVHSDAHGQKKARYAHAFLPAVISATGDQPG